MVVVTEYGFDVEAQRAARPPGPELVEVEIGVGDAADAWTKLGVMAGPHLDLRPDGPRASAGSCCRVPGGTPDASGCWATCAFVGR
ncbi:MAG TPA: hypothetical protein VHF51_11720 [Solirubrobacteraceae bacterium]|nr:hypothetical protein [Solirubrobacteraceae bacterium]